MSLERYRQKRSFDRTPEPPGTKGARRGIFVVQKHKASRLHYDFRLEVEGVLVSWAVPKGPSMNPKERHLAVQVEDHPLEYADFEGEIPEGNYGAGTVEIWDRGFFLPRGNAKEGIIRGRLEFVLLGEKLKGGFALIRLRDQTKNWLLIKMNDPYADSIWRIEGQGED